MTRIPPFLTKPPKRYRCDRLFGGPLHRKRHPAARNEPEFGAVMMAQMTSMPLYHPNDPLYLPTPKTLMYTRREAAFGPGKVVSYYADSRLSDAEASDLFFTYLLDRSCISKQT